MNKAENAIQLAQVELDKIKDPTLREFSQIIFAPMGTKVPKTSIEHAKPLAEHPKYDEIMGAGIIALFTRDLQASSR